MPVAEKIGRSVGMVMPGGEEALRERIAELEIENEALRVIADLEKKEVAA